MKRRFKRFVSAFASGILRVELYRPCSASMRKYVPRSNVRGVDVGGDEIEIFGGVLPEQEFVATTLQVRRTFDLNFI
tara:strand:+ start:388 stop:618 length:231 start_codon:yes stop_codon:yes gene_type:complete